MDKNLLALRAAAASAREQVAMRYVRQLQAALSNERIQAVGEREALAKEIPIARPTITAAEKKFQPSPNDLPTVAKAIKDIQQKLTWAKMICQRPTELDNWINDLDGIQPQSFKSLGVETLCDLKRRALLPILGGSVELRRLPDELADLEKILVDEVAYLAERPQVFPRPEAFSPRPSLGDTEQGKQYDQFETRK